MRPVSNFLIMQLSNSRFLLPYFSRLVRMKKAVIMKLSRQSALNLFYHHYIHIKNAKRAYNGCSVSIFQGYSIDGLCAS